MRDNQFEFDDTHEDERGATLFIVFSLATCVLMLGAALLLGLAV